MVVGTVARCPPVRDTEESVPEETDPDSCRGDVVRGQLYEGGWVC